MKLYYSKCNELPMQTFVDILVNGNILALSRIWWVKYFFKNKLKKVWDEIFSEYSTLIEGDQSNVTLSLLKDISFMRNKLYIINVAVYAMKLKYSERAANLLRSQGFDFKFREDTYKQDIERVFKRSKTIIADLLKKEGEFGRMKSTGEVKEQDYIDMAFFISKYAGHHLSLKQITVSEFCAAYNAYNKEVARQNELQNKRKERVNGHGK